MPGVSGRQPCSLTAAVAVCILFLSGTAANASTVIQVTKAANGVDLVITIVGSPTYTIYRAPTGDFTFDTETLIDTLPGSSYTDVGAVRAAAPVYYYDAVAVGESSPATAAGGNPQPTIAITLLTPNAGKEGDSVVISGATFSQFYTENLVTFNSRPATVTAVGAGTITVTVPAGATSGPVQVRVGRLLSNTLPFTLSPVGAFGNLTGINTDPATVHVFVTDTSQGAATSLIEDSTHSRAGRRRSIAAQATFAVSRTARRTTASTSQTRARARMPAKSDSGISQGVTRAVTRTPPATPRTTRSPASQWARRWRATCSSSSQIASTSKSGG